jgi:HEAT repeat protein
MKSWKYWVYAGVIIVATGGFAMYWNAEPKWQENTVENLEHERYEVRRGAVRQLAKNGDESAIAHLMERLNDRSE